MKLYHAERPPNPRLVRIYLAEKGITVPLVPVDISTFEHKSASFAAKNPMKQVPVLELDDGTIITETIAICRYFEALHPTPPLFGVGALGEAQVEMWRRRMEFGLYIPIAAVFRHLHPALAQHEVPQVPAWGEANKPRVIDFLMILDAQLANRRFVCGEDYTIADITGLVSMHFLKPAGLNIPENLANVRRWYEEILARPSTKA